MDLKVCLLCSTLDRPCGISDYTLSLSDALDKEGSDVLLMNDIKNFKPIQDFDPDFVNIEFEYSMYQTSELNRFLNELKRKGIRSAITMHGWDDWSVDENNIIEHKVDRIIVLNGRFKRLLIERGNSADKIIVVPMGSRQFNLEERDKVRDKLRIEKDKKVVGMYGFFELWKGFEKGAKAVSILQKKYPDILLLLRTFSKGYDMAKKAEKDFDEIVDREGIDIIEVGGRDMYLPLEKVASILHACDVILYPYRELFTYSSSAAIRDGISSFVPIVASDITFFGDIPDNCVVKVKTNDPREISVGILEVFENSELRENMIENQKKLVEKYSWNDIGKLYIDRLQKIIGD